LQHICVSNGTITEKLEYQIKPLIILFLHMSKNHDNSMKQMFQKP